MKFRRDKDKPGEFAWLDVIMFVAIIGTALAAYLYDDRSAIPPSDKTNHERTQPYE